MQKVCAAAAVAAPTHARTLYILNLWAPIQSCAYTPSCIDSVHYWMRAV